ncbi:FadR/GntR family transcriptional regulator [Paenibacillus larvae]|uniref:FadR/GntR family transcriptional regulator n=1 Tax=Paenibacillus larvae TaxID=1464 RepID=UPI0028BDE761|nr:FadR/GntR family transcriptional regulator [Paenibacillus larvae]
MDPIILCSEVSHFHGNKKAVRTSLSKQIAAQFETLIETGTWQVGTKIPPEPELVELLGVSRNTIREAVQALIHNGMLEARQGDGTYVTASNSFEAAMFRRLRGSDVGEILEVRYLLEREIARLAALRRTEEDVKKIGNWLEQRNKQARARQNFVQADLKFHMAIAEAAHNTILIELYKYMYDHLRMTISSVVDNAEVAEEHIQTHRRLFEAIRDKNKTEAEIAASQIIEVIQQEWGLNSKRG